jgi:uncharacterized protein YcnI
MSKIVRVLPPVGVAAGVLALLAAPAAAHITPDKDEVAAGSYNTVTLSVGHGCDESPTKQLVIEVPEGLNTVTPQVHTGWDITIQKEALTTPVTDAHGEELTERMASVTITAKPGNELPDGFRDTFTLGFKTPETPGEYMFFKTVQKCAVGETPWIEEYTGEGEEPEHPAPVVKIGPAEEEGHDDGATETTVAGGDGEGESAAGDGSADDDDSSNGLGIAGIVLGGLGLITGGAALATTRKKAASSS